MTTQPCQHGIQHRNGRRGAAIVEFAIVVPVFFMIVFAAIEFGRLNVVRHTADNAAYEAARAGIVPGATRADVEAKANELLAIVGTRNASVEVLPANLGAAADEITVRITVPTADNGWVVPKFTGNTILSSTATLRTERYRGIQ